MARIFRTRKTKVIATIGPACDNHETLKNMISAGMNVARLNLSHGGLEQHKETLQRIRSAANESATHIATMVDTRGIEIRSGKLENGAADLQKGAVFSLYSDDQRIGNAAGAAVSYRHLPEIVVPGTPILLDDGAIELSVESVIPGTVNCRIVRGGLLGNGKGVNLPETHIDSSEAMGAAAREDILFAIENDVDYIAASFVQSADDIIEIRRVLEEKGARIPVIAKIENKAGVEFLKEIIAEADGAMVARGDLGVEMSAAEVPMVQKDIIRTTVSNGKPVITATQMLDSMERHLRPTRAEVSDVANAILDGTSAVMLSGETAIGRYPVEAVRTLSAIAMRAEASLREYGYLQKVAPHPSNIVTEAVSQAVVTVTTHLHATAIITLTQTGFTARSISKYRPDCPILAVTPSEHVMRKLCMNWGVIPILYRGNHSDDERIAFGIQRTKELGFIDTGDIVVATAGRSQRAGGTDLISVVTVEP